MKQKKIEALFRLFAGSDAATMTYAQDDDRLHLSRLPAGDDAEGNGEQAEARMPEARTPAARTSTSTQQPTPGAAAKATDPTPSPDPVTPAALTAPMIGTFYHSSSPDAPPFVQVGDTVAKGDVIGIIEAMKLMNQIEADRDGTIAAILVQNGELVEYGQPLFAMR